MAIGIARGYESAKAPHRCEINLERQAWRCQELCFGALEERSRIGVGWWERNSRRTCPEESGLPQ